jgi:hypothetical protein
MPPIQQIAICTSARYDGYMLDSTLENTNKASLKILPKSFSGPILAKNNQRFQDAN